MKKCSICGEYKDFSEYSKCANSKDGKKPSCKNCLASARRDYHNRNKEKENKRSMLYYFLNKVELGIKNSLYMKEYYIKNKERIDTRIKEYRDTHPETRRKHVWNRRSRIANAEGDGITEKQWKDLLLFYENKCLCCGSKDKLQLDHIVPLSRGGEHDISNAQPLCGTCNNRKGTKTIDYRR